MSEAPVKLPFLFTDRDRHGNVRHYVRRKGVGKKRLRAAPGTPEFIDEYRDALAALDSAAKTPSADPITLRWLVREFEGSHRFLKVTPREQRNRHLLVRAILEEETKPGSGVRLGDCPLKRFEATHVRLIRDRKMATPSAANHRLSNLSLIFSWGVEERREHVKTNPCLGVRPLEYKSEGWHTWTEAEIEAYETRHPLGSQARLALDLLLYTGARRGDVVALGPKSLTRIVNPVTRQPETWLQFKPGKTSKSTGKVVVLPVLPELSASIAATPHGLATFLINSYGKPHASGDSFANWFKDRVVEADLPEHCSPHGLRKAGACRAADNGATEKQMMAIFGWTTSRLAAHYAQKADDMKLAASAVHVLTKA
jgi:integrase